MTPKELEQSEAEAEALLWRLSCPRWPTHKNSVERAFQRIRVAERDACAKLIEEEIDKHGDDCDMCKWLGVIVTALGARGRSGQ